MKEQTLADTQNRVILYIATDGKVTADVFFAQDNFWLTQRTMAELRRRQSLSKNQGASLSYRLLLDCDPYNFKPKTQVTMHSKALLRSSNF